VVLQFLADYRDFTYRDAFKLFVDGALTEPEAQRFRGQFVTFNDIVNLRWPTLCEFYGHEDPKETEPDDGR